MKRCRRNAISYETVDECMDNNKNTLQIGDYIIVDDQKKGPVTKILHEITLENDNPIKFLIYCENDVYVPEKVRKHQCSEDI